MRTDRPPTLKLAPVTSGMAQLTDGLIHLHQWLEDQAEDSNEATEALRDRMELLGGYGAISPDWQCFTVEPLDRDGCHTIAIRAAVEGDWQVRRAFTMVDDGPLEDADWQELDPAVIGDTVDAVLYLASQGRLKLRLVEWEAAGPEDGETFAVAVDPS